MHISAQGKLGSYRFYEAVMHSKARLTYNKVHAILQGDPELRQQYAENLTNIDNLNSLYKQMAKVRAGRGAIEFETVETRFIFNSHRKIEQIVPIHRNEAHKIIEECMILANVAAAKLVEKNEAAALYRVHEQPDGDRFANFKRFLAELGISADLPQEPTPLELMHLLQKLQQAGVVPQQVVLQALDQHAVTAWLADTLRQPPAQLADGGHVHAASLHQRLQARR